MDEQILRQELTTDPLSRGYASMTDEQVADSLNAQNRQTQRDTLSGAEMFEQIEPSEFISKTNALQAEVWNIVHLGEAIKVSPGSRTRARMIAIFGAGSATITNLAAILNITVSRADELGLGIVTAGAVGRARAS